MWIGWLEFDLLLGDVTLDQLQGGVVQLDDESSFLFFGHRFCHGRRVPRTRGGKAPGSDPGWAARRRRCFGAGSYQVGGLMLMQ